MWNIGARLTKINESQKKPSKKLIEDKKKVFDTFKQLLKIENSPPHLGIHILS